MFIQTELTPNPATIKFIPGGSVSPDRVLNFRRGENADASPLALRLLKLEGVDGVFLGADFISVTCAPGRDWLTLKPLVLAAIMEHVTSSLPIVDVARLSADGSSHHSDAPSEIVQKICDLIDERVRPAVARDGGDIVFERFDKGIVYVQMRGACAGCPSSTATLKTGVERMLRHYLPDVLEVRSSTEDR